MKRISRLRNRKPHNAPPRPIEKQAIHVRAYSPANWHERAGVAKKRKQIEKRGLRNFHKWRFVTLTTARMMTDDGRYCTTKEMLALDNLTAVNPCAVYMLGRDHMFRFMEKLHDKMIIAPGTPWAWKLEMQSDGFPHWHLLIGRKQKFTGKEMRQISDAWGFGRVNCEMIHSKGDAFRYTFKYAFKAVMQYKLDDDGLETETAIALPDWFLDYRATKLVRVKQDDGSIKTVEKTVTFARARFWQTSSGFYTEYKKIFAKPKEKKTSIYPQTVRELVQRQQRSIVAISRKLSGKYITSKVLTLNTSLTHFWAFCGWDACHQSSVGLGCWSMIIPASILKKYTLCKTSLILLFAQNLMTLRRALALVRSGQTLRTC